MRQVDTQRELNEELVTLSHFAESYNETLPPGFPPASDEALKEFQLTYPLLFKNGNSWSIDRHRKRFMDWNSIHHSKV